MSGKPGVTPSKKKDGSLYYRAAMTIHSKHISLGSFPTEETAYQAYCEAGAIIREQKYTLTDYTSSFCLDFPKFVTLLNYRDNGIYFKTPIYLYPGYFYYYLDPEHYLIFDREDLFFYANHKIQARGGYLFVYDYGSQYSILSRYGIRGYAKKGTDYMFVNRNDYDFRYENIQVLHAYVGVSREGDLWKCVIHIRGNVIVGRYPDELSAAIAYNKAADTLAANGITRKYVRNFITQYTPEEYHAHYRKIIISKRILDCRADIALSALKNPHTYDKMQDDSDR